jgi:hypothetical protein
MMTNSSKALYRVRGDGITPRWIHYSRRGATVILRRLDPTDIGTPAWIETTYRLPSDQTQLAVALQGDGPFSLAEIAARTEDAIDISADRLRIEAVDGWRRVFSRLDEPGVLDIHTAGGNIELAASPGKASSRIPQTRLRRFYQTLRELSTHELQKNIANYFTEAGTDRSTKLQVLFEESVAHFSRYDNSFDCFRPTRTPHWCDRYRDRQEAFARCLAARLGDSSWHSLGGVLPIELQAVDYEISPFRTTGRASFEDGTVGTSGGGGLDLLLRDREDGVWVAEVKAPGDSTAFMALIQALTYAVELTTGAQARRLKRCYPEAFANLAADANGCRCNLLLIYERGDAPKLLDQARTLARGLMNPSNSAVARKLHRIAIASVSLDADRVDFKCEFSTDSSDVTTGT